VNSILCRWIIVAAVSISLLSQHPAPTAAQWAWSWIVRTKLTQSRASTRTFRDKYRSWLNETGARMKVQQEWMRHASIQTTMNIYGQAMSSSKREANGKVVEMALKPAKASA
jgi:integrase